MIIAFLCRTHVNIQIYDSICGSKLTVQTKAQPSETMKLNDIIITMLNQKAHYDVTTSYGATFLRNDIESVTGENLSANTIKRLVGNLPYESSPRDTTLEIIAKYLGYGSWQLLNDYLNQKISEFNSHNIFYELDKMPDDQMLEIEWDPDRKIIIRHKSGYEYEVIFSENSKLSVGDILTLSQIAIGFPFMVRKVVRAGKDLGSYTASPELGLKKIVLLQ